MITLLAVVLGVAVGSVIGYRAWGRPAPPRVWSCARCDEQVVQAEFDRYRHARENSP